MSALPTTTIAGLPSFSLPLAGTESVPVDDGAATRKVPASAVAALAAGQLGVINFADPAYAGNLQSAVSAVPSTGGVVWVPVTTRLRIGQPLLIQTSNTTIQGAFAPEVVNVLADFHGWGCVIMPKGIAPTLGATLLTGAGGSLTLVNSLSDAKCGYYNLRDVGDCNLDGLAAFCLEFAYQPQTSIVLGGLVMSSGRRTSGESVTTSAGIDQDSSGHPRGYLNVAGTPYVLTGSGLVMATGTTYYLALTFDGTTIRLFGGALGDTVALLASQAASGTITHPLTEDFTTGPEVQQWPETTFNTGAANGLIDGIRLSNVARYTSAFAAPSAKPSTDGNTLICLNFDSFIPDGGGAPGTAAGPILKAGNRNKTAYLPWRPVGLPAEVGFVRLSCLTISAGSQDGGIFLQLATDFDIDRVTCSSVSYGLKAVNNCFNNSIRRFRASGTNSTSPSGQTNAVAGLVLAHAATNNRIAEVETQGFAFDAVCDGGVQWDTFRCSTEAQTVVHLILRGGDVLLNRFSIDDEPSGTPVNYVAGLWLDNVKTFIANVGSISNSITGAPANVLVRVTGGSSLVFNGVTFGGGAATTAVFASSPSPASPIVFTTSIKSPSGLAWGS